MGSLFSQGRVAQRNIDGVRPNYCSPQKVLDEREKAWDRFFDKYVNEKPDDKELNIDTLDEIWDQDESDDEDGESNEDSDNGDNDDDDGVDDNNVAEHHKEYNSKRRAPMCMPRTLVQYWIDTGHSPHQLVREDVHAESGSSLSEEEHSRLGKSMVRKESCCKYKPVENSQCSSVDTAAYILSNANVTKKAEMMALVEGSKRCEEIIASKPPRTEKSLIKELRVDMGDKNIPFHFVEQNRSFVEDSHTLHTSISNDTSNVFSKNGNSVKLSEVLPALEHLDASQRKLEATDKTPITCSMLSKDRTQKESAVFELSGKILRSQNNAQTPKRWSENSFEYSTKKFLNRRKLYTGRNSPVDLMIGTTQTTTATPAMIRSTRTAATTTTMRSRTKGDAGPQRRSHPALEPPSNDDKRRKTLALGCRSRARRKRKRGSQRETGMSYELRGSQDDAVWQKKNSSPIDGEDNKAKDKMRYTDFFESLGLTPCKTIMAQGSVERTSKMEDTRLSNDEEKGQGRNWIEEAREELGTAGGEDSMSCRKIQDSVAKHLGGKVVRVQLVRLSDKCLARYTRRESQNLTSLKSCRHGSFSCSANEGERVSKSSDIELMNNISQDSDSSTILIYSCNNATEDPDFTSNRSMLATNSLVNEKSSGRAGGLPARIENIESTSMERSNENCEAIKHKVESSQHGKSSDETGKYEELIKSRNVVVRLEKLSLVTNLSQVTKTRDNLKKAANLDSNGSFEKSDVVETECITVGSRGFHATSKVANEKRWTGSAIDSTSKLSLCSGENDNDYLEKQMVMRGQSIGDIDGSVCHKEEQQQQVSARNGEKSEYTKILGKGAIAKKLRPRLSKKVVCSLRGVRPRVEWSMRSPRFKTILDSDIESSPGSVWSTGSRRGPTEKLPERQSENRARAKVDELGKNVSSKWRVLEDSDSGCSLLPLEIEAEMKISAKADDRISTRVRPPLPTRKSKRRQNSLKRSFLWISNGASVGGEDERGRSVMRKKLRKRNVVEKSIESKSENQVAPTIPFNKSKSSCEKSTSRTNRSASKRSADKNSSDSDDADPNPLKKRQLCTNNIFSKVPLDENGEETRATFEKRGNLYIQKSVVMLESLNLGTTRSRTDRIDQGPSRMRFQTKLDPDSEEDDDADV